MPWDAVAAAAAAAAAVAAAATVAVLENERVQAQTATGLARLLSCFTLVSTCQAILSRTASPRTGGEGTRCFFRVALPCPLLWIRRHKRDTTERPSRNSCCRCCPFPCVRVGEERFLTHVSSVGPHVPGAVLQRGLPDNLHVVCRFRRPWCGQTNPLVSPISAFRVAFLIV